MKARKYYVEFVGPHTAGKTSTIQQVVDGKWLKPCRAIYPQQLYRSRINFALSIPILIIKNIEHLWFLSLFFCKYAAFRWTNIVDAMQYLVKMIILHPYYSRYDFDIWLKDDMLHLLPHIVFKKGVNIQEAFKEYFYHFSYLYDGIVYINVPRNVMKKRFAERFDSESERYIKDRKRVHEHAFEQTEEMKQMLIQQTRVPLLILEGEADLQQNIAETAAFIKKKVLKDDKRFVI